MGADVRALYPSMDQTATSELAFEAVINSQIEFSGIDYELLVIYLKLVLGDIELRRLGLGHLIPHKKQPDDSNSLLTKKNREKQNWDFHLNKPNERDKKYMVAAMVKIAVIVMSKTSCYSFGGDLFLQFSGAGIGLRGSASLAKVTMGMWDKAWARLMYSWGIRSKRGIMVKILPQEGPHKSQTVWTRQS